MKLGAEPKKIAILVGLLAFAGYQFLSWDSGTTPTSPAPVRPPSAETSRPSPGAPSAAPTAATPARGVRRAEASRRSSSSRTLREFRPVFQAQPTEDPASIDPSLRLDLLERVRSVNMRGGQRNLFQFGTRPPDPATSKPLPTVAKIIPGEGATPDGAGASSEPKEAPPPPIPLQYFGYTQKGGHGPKRAFFIEGEEIFVASEGDLVKRRYKVVRIGINSVVVEDTSSNREETLRMVEQVG